jgi:Tfp pilus assembly protein PilX
MKRQPARTRPQRGVATLIVVMVLFFIATMVAAYASRNIVFEQRTGANYQRATSAQEVAEAGLQWAVAQLNAGRIDDNCAPSAAGTDPSFRQRYLIVDDATGGLQRRNHEPTPGTLVPLTPTCQFDPDTQTWVCACPRNSAPALTPSTSARVAPAFRVSFGDDIGLQPGLIRLNVTACTRLSDDCLNPDAVGVANEGRAAASTLVYLGALSTPVPQAALIARGSVTATNLTVSNSRIGGSGITVQAGGTVGTGVALNTLAGNALGGLGTTLQGDAALGGLADLDGAVEVSARDRFFGLVFNTLPATARNQPAMLRLGDCGGGCDELDLAAAVGANPGRPVWVTGDLAIDTGVTIGSPTEPVLLVIDGGDLQISASDAVIHGLVFVRPVGADSTVPGTGRVIGALVVDGNLTGSSTDFGIEYDGDVVKAARLRTGSFITVPGAWRDSLRSP